jgi:hypothetical protein
MPFSWSEIGKIVVLTLLVTAVFSLATWWTDGTVAESPVTVDVPSAPSASIDVEATIDDLKWRLIESAREECEDSGGQAVTYSYPLRVRCITNEKEMLP